MAGIYGILDTVTQDFVQNVLSISRHEAPMVRMFTDLLAQKQGPIGQHPADHALVRVGYIDDDNHISDTVYTVVITGKQWLATQTPSDIPLGEKHTRQGA